MYKTLTEMHRIEKVDHREGLHTYEVCPIGSVVELVDWNKHICLVRYQGNMFITRSSNSLEAIDV